MARRRRSSAKPSTPSARSSTAHRFWLGRRARKRLDWLTRAGRAADATVTEMKQGGADDALRIAAEGLRAAFEHHKLKLAAGTGRKPGDAVRVVGARSLAKRRDRDEPAAAKAVLKDQSSGRGRVTDRIRM